jgi:RNA polymerase sigma factor (sigma-70 family)
MYYSHYQAIYRFAFRMIGNAEDAKDVVQETFIRLYRTLESESEITHPKAWLYTVSANLCINRVKKAKRRREILADRPRTTQPESTPETDLIMKERLDLIRHSVRALPERERILLMLYQDGLSYSEMARVINVKASSLGKLLSRAIGKLAEAIRNGRRS